MYGECVKKLWVKCGCAGTKGLMRRPAPWHPLYRCKCNLWLNILYIYTCTRKVCKYKVACYSTWFSRIKQPRTKTSDTNIPQTCLPSVSIMAIAEGTSSAEPSASPETAITINTCWQKLRDIFASLASTVENLAILWQMTALFAEVLSIHVGMCATIIRFVLRIQDDYHI